MPWLPDSPDELAGPLTVFIMAACAVWLVVWVLS